MEEKNETGAEQPTRFTYEQLEQIAGNLSNQVQQLSTRLQEANMFNMFKRLDYCFKVVEVAPTLSATMFSPGFVERCAKEIEELMTPPAPVEEETKKE
nr:MAG TPA: hypothetical protein [Bacteriophage sp.]